MICDLQLRFFFPSIDISGVSLSLFWLGRPPHGDRVREGYKRESPLRHILDLFPYHFFFREEIEAIAHAVSHIFLLVKRRGGGEKGPITNPLSRSCSAPPFLRSLPPHLNITTVRPTPFPSLPFLPLPIPNCRSSYRRSTICSLSLSHSPSRLCIQMS